MGIDHYRGDSKTLELTVTDGNGDAVNLTGAYIWFTVKKRAKDVDSKAVITKATANVDGGGDEQILITSGSLGLVEIYLVPADTEDLNPPDYKYQFDVQVKTAAGKVYTVARDTFQLLSDVTQGTT